VSMSTILDRSGPAEPVRTHASVKGRCSGRGRVTSVTQASLVALALSIMVAGVIARQPAGHAASAPAASASTPPSPTRFVTDGAGFLSTAAEGELEQRLAQYEHATGHQVLLWIGQTTGLEPLEPWAVRAFAAWRVGRKGLDDGVVLFILAADRKVRIEVGYGLEDRLTDARAARIIGDQMVPRLRAGDRDGAARAGVSGVLMALGGEKGAPQNAVPTPEARPQVGWGTLIVLGLVGILVLGFLITHPTLALMLMTTIGSNRGRGGGGWGGGGFGGGGFSGGGGRSGGGGASGSW
jgi:uncharacterized protein